MATTRETLKGQLVESQQRQQQAYQIVDHETRLIIALQAKLELLDELENVTREGQDATDG